MQHAPRGGPTNGEGTEVNPKNHRPYLAIRRGAYLSTLRRIGVVRHRLAGDLASHGERLDTARAEEVARRLAAGAEPAFEDFFVDGRVALRRPPLCLEHDGPGPNIASGAASISAA